MLDIELITYSVDGSRQGFGRGSNKNNNNPPKINNGAPGQPPTSYSQAAPAFVSSPQFSSGLTVDSTPNDGDTVKYFFQEKYAPLNVKGNFLTLCACPKNVELGEWLAHQSIHRSGFVLLGMVLMNFSVVEQNRLLHGMLQVIQEINGLTGFPICNETTCPTMSAGR
jgi:hypothetical protein